MPQESRHHSVLFLSLDRHGFKREYRSKMSRFPKLGTTVEPSSVRRNEFVSLYHDDMCEDGDIFEWGDEIDITPQSDDWLKRVNDGAKFSWISECNEDTPRPLNPLYQEMMDDCAREQEKRMKLKRPHLCEDNVRDMNELDMQRRLKLKCVKKRSLEHRLFVLGDMDDSPSRRIDMNEANSLHIHSDRCCESNRFPQMS